ncbi:hypothetical protein CONPUDRAFT_160023 [Coniophora puteana RWD-64-598 SS2]|uniref:Uncharacterized protein n=1 Tax=Coniophora puteana (strain RWD-64-598) TaxID=741705 RepID=R7SDS4_CONPW|nr:uncharacterized protein CONPUDRAFT_160023 [Coniophora puteana RWD-64-598 SS2]EIW74316.1 hypothetical protein CONPUDRAFT_160023 [Coniophora puteana RWD-64-598 SS2]
MPTDRSLHQMGDINLHEIFPVAEYPFPPDDVIFEYSDAKVIAVYKDYIITSPNADFVPEPFIFENEEVKARADGRFGIVDAFQWPQLYSEKFEWAMCIPRKDPFYAHERRWFAWENLRDEDFLRSARYPTMYSLGPNKQLGVSGLVSQAKEAVTAWMTERNKKEHSITIPLRILEGVVTQLQSPQLHRDIVKLYAEAQRRHLDITAFLDYVRYAEPKLRVLDFYPAPVTEKWMGAFTSDPNVCERLHIAGIPVWFIRIRAQIPSTIKIKNRVQIDRPDHIVRENYFDTHARLEPFEPICPPMPACNERLRVQFTGVSASDLSTVRQMQGSPAQGAPGFGGGSGRFQVQGRKAGLKQGARDTWSVLSNDYTPDVPSIWTNALDRAKSAKGQHDAKQKKQGLPPKAPFGHVAAGYRFPDPCALVTPVEPKRKTTFLVNWLNIRSQRLEDVDLSPFVAQPNGQNWRDLLTGVILEDLSPNRIKDRQERASGRELFGSVITSIVESGDFWSHSPSQLWQGMDVSPRFLIREIDIVKKIVWEVAEFNFRFELLALDHAMARPLWVKDPAARKQAVCDVFPDGGLTREGQWLPAGEHEVGLNSRDPQTAATAWERFRVLLSGWHGASQTRPIDATTLTDLYLQVSPLATDYCWRFFQQAGRAPIVPFAFPFS